MGDFMTGLAGGFIGVKFISDPWGLIRKMVASVIGGAAAFALLISSIIIRNQIYVNQPENISALWPIVAIIGVLLFISAVKLFTPARITVFSMWAHVYAAAKSSVLTIIVYAAFIFSLILQFQAWKSGIVGWLVTMPFIVAPLSLWAGKRTVQPVKSVIADLLTAQDAVSRVLRVDAETIDLRNSGSIWQPVFEFTMPYLVDGQAYYRFADSFYQYCPSAKITHFDGRTLTVVRDHD